jgi:hypothetical protein
MVAHMKTDPVAIALSKINAPFRAHLSADDVAACIRSVEMAHKRPGHMASFFGELSPEIQMAFADTMGIERQALVAAARAFSKWSGEHYEIAA